MKAIAPGGGALLRVAGVGRLFAGSVGKRIAV
jgi:hypothetical protein